MNAFGLLPPFLDPRQQLWEAQARGRMLREEWRMANGRPRVRRTGTVTRFRARVGRSIVRLGERLAAPEVVSPRMSGARQPQTGC